MTYEMLVSIDNWKNKNEVFSKYLETHPFTAEEDVHCSIKRELHEIAQDAQVEGIEFSCFSECVLKLTLEDSEDWKGSLRSWSEAHQILQLFYNRIVKMFESYAFKVK